MRALKKAKGFTLVEIIVSMVVVSIILVFAASFFFTGGTMFSNTVKSNTAKLVGDNSLSFIADRIKFASKLELKSAGSASDAKYSNVLYVADNKIGYNSGGNDNSNIFGDDFYSGSTVRISAKALSSNNIELKVTVYDFDNIEKYSVSDTIKLANVSLDKSVIELSGVILEQEVINPVISFEQGRVIASSQKLPDDTFMWDNEFLHYDGYSYEIKLEKDKTYEFEGRYFLAKDNATRKKYDQNGIAFPTPWSPDFKNHLIEIHKT